MSPQLRLIHCLPIPPDLTTRLLARRQADEAAGLPPQGRRRDLEPLHGPLDATVAARRFLTWLQDECFTGPQRWGGDQGLWALYGWHCHEIRRQPIAHNVLANALGKLLGDENVRRESDYSQGDKRRKLTVYVIPEAEPEFADELPAPKLPRLTTVARERRVERHVEHAEPMRRAA